MTSLEQLAPPVGHPSLYAQGYLLARPQTIDDLLPLIDKLPTHTESLVRGSITRLPDAQSANTLPLVSAAVRN